MQSLEANKFKVAVNLPDKYNKTEYDHKIAKAVAKILTETLKLQDIEKLINIYRGNKLE